MVEKKILARMNEAGQIMQIKEDLTLQLILISTSPL
jgi:hypothetical protein